MKHKRSKVKPYKSTREVFQKMQGVDATPMPCLFHV